MPLRQSRAGSGAGEIPLLQALAAAARRGWRGLTGRGPIPRKAGPGAGAEEEGAGRAPSATPAGRGFGASRTQSPNHPRRWQGGKAGQNVETQREAARHPLLVARCLSVPKGSWVTLSLASLFSHTSAFPYNGKMSSDESCPRPSSCNFVGETFSFLLPPYLETQAYGA